MSEQQNPEHQLEYLTELRQKYEEALSNAQKTEDYTEAEKLKEELETRLSDLEAQFIKPEPVTNNIESEGNYEIQFEEKAIPILKKCLEKEYISPNNLLINLAGMSSSEAYKLRDQTYASAVVLNNSIPYTNILLLKSYAGVDTEHAWKFREANLDLIAVLDSLSGIDSERAWKIRDEFRVNSLFDKMVSITGLDSDKAWAIRESLMKWHNASENTLALVFNSLAGIDSDRAWKFRDSISFNGLVIKELQSFAYSIIGLDSDQAWKLRSRIEIVARALVPDSQARKALFISLAKSLAGLDSERAWELRSKLDQDDTFISLAGLNNQTVYESWEDAVNIKGYHERFPKWIEGVNGDPLTAIGWRTAKKYQKKD